MYKSYNTRLVCRKVEEPTERITAGGIVVPGTADKKHYIEVEVVDAPEDYDFDEDMVIASKKIGRKVLISSSTSGINGYFFPEEADILAYVG